MSQASTSSAGGDGANIELASLLPTSTDSGTGMLRRRVSFKPTSASGSNESPQSSFSSPVPYTPLPPPRTSSAKSSVAIDIGSHAGEEGEAGTEQRIRNDIARIVKEQDSESLREIGGVDRVRNVLLGQLQHSEESTIDNGNSPVQVQGTSFSSFLWNSCKHNRYTISMLLISAVLSFATGFKQEGPRYGWHDGVAIVFAVLLLVAFSSLRERKMMKLAEREGPLKFTVKRGEESPLVDLAISDIVVGDMVRLGPHDEVPVDGLLVDDSILVLAEGIKKEKVDRHEKPFLIAGSKVIAGNGWMLVVSVGNKPNLAEMQSSVSSNPEKRSLLDSLIEKPICYIDKASLCIFTLVALVVFIRLICKKDGDGGGLPEIKGNISVGWLREVLERIFLRPSARISILAGLFTVVILSVQHGVPLMVTISLKYQVDKVVSDQGAVLNDSSACTTMGLVSVICIDVSGGLISKPMEVGRTWMGETDISKFELEGSETGLVVLDMLKQGVGLSVLAPELSLSPMSNSLVSWAETTWGMDIESFPEKFDILKHSKLNSDEEGSGVLVRKVGANEQVLHLHWSGAASAILEMCSKYYDSKGEPHAMENQKNKFGQVITEMEDSGLKPIAFAYNRQREEQEELEQDELTLLALIGLKYKCQESTKLALEDLRNTGIQIKLVSEDDIMLVKHIACELGIEVPVHGHLEGEELQDLNDKARLDKVDLAIVMGSFRPEDKLLMVQCLQDKGHVVAFVGKRLMTNHTSEVPKVADVGIIHTSLSRITDRESSGISITCFSALKPIVRAGRSKYHSIQKFIQLQLTVSISGFLITLITTIITGKSPLTAIQLIWVNVLMCLLGSLMMAMELSSEEEHAKNPSDRRNQPIITKKIWTNVVIQVLYQAIVCMILEFGGHVTDREKKVRETMIFNTFLLCQLFNLLNTMNLLKEEVLKIVVQSYCFWVALGGCILMQVMVIEYAKGLADCTRLNTTEWGICVPVGAVPWVLEWALKKILGTNCASPSPSGSPEPTQTQLPGFHLSLMMLLLFPLGLMAITFRY